MPRIEFEFSVDDQTKVRGVTNEVRLSAMAKGNGYQSTVTFPDGTSMSSAETFPSVGEAVRAAALKLLGMPERLEAIDQTDEVDLSS